MNKLISMTDFILNQKQSESFNEKTFINESLISLEKIRNYANFLRQPLKLEMLIPCDEDRNVFEEPKIEDYFDDGFNFEFNQKHFKDVVLKEYYNAKEKVLFEGFKFKEYERMICFEKKGIEIFIYNKNYQTFSAPRGRIITIEDLIMYEFELTESSVKQIGM